MLIGNNSVVSIHYKLTGDDGKTLDESTEGPLTYLHGASGIIPGLEKELTGKTAGAEFKVTITPDEAYGDHQPQMVQQSPRSTFPADMELELGMQFTANSEGGEMTVVITEIGDETVTVDANHPLAGLTLHFEGKIDQVRDATEEELSHGHAH
jgi:FKBP-type peptidyl-prolyl cis-trans isomerase SlyD